VMTISIALGGALSLGLLIELSVKSNH